MGHDVYVIDYQQPFMVEHFKPKRYWGIRSFISTLFHGDLKEYIYHSSLPYVRYRNFENFKHQHLRLTQECYGTHDIPAMELYIIGSDQPWNPDLTAGTDLVYYGQFKRPKDSHLITYAMSGSEKAFSKVGWDNIKRYCENFDALSFREESITHKFKTLTGRHCETVLDPTLIADTKLWEPLLNHKWNNRKYVLLYHVGGPKDVIENMTAQARKMASDQHIEFIDASHYYYSPTDFVSLVRYASLIITASFHAMVFSIIFKKHFCVVKTGQASDIRFEALLGNLNAKEHLLAMEDVSANNIKLFKSNIDLMMKLRASSLSFLSKNIVYHV